MQSKSQTSTNHKRVGLAFIIASFLLAALSMTAMSEELSQKNTSYKHLKAEKNLAYRHGNYIACLNVNNRLSYSDSRLLIRTQK